MKYKEGNGVAEKSFVSIGEDNRRRLDELEARVAMLEELKGREMALDGGKLKELVEAEIARIRKRVDHAKADYIFEIIWTDTMVANLFERILDQAKEE